MDIGHRMKELRIQYGLTQQELADRAELTKGFISQLERNQNSPSIGTLLDIIQCLGTTPAEFFTDENRRAMRIRIPIHPAFLEEYELENDNLLQNETSFETKGF